MKTVNESEYLRVSVDDEVQRRLARDLFEHVAVGNIAMQAPDAIPSQYGEEPAFYTSLPGEPVTAGFLVECDDGALLRVTISREARDV